MGWNNRIEDLFSFPDRKKPRPRRDRGMSLGLMLFIIATVLILATVLFESMEECQLPSAAIEQIDQLYVDSGVSTYTIVDKQRVNEYVWRVLVDPPVVIYEQSCRKLILRSEYIDYYFGSVWLVRPDFPCD
jgi:hypothetical protein